VFSGGSCNRRVRFSWARLAAGLEGRENVITLRTCGKALSCEGGLVNHSLLTLEALRSRGVLVLGMAFIGDANDSSEAAIVRFGRVRRLGRLPWLDPLTPQNQLTAFAGGFETADFV